MNKEGYKMKQLKAKLYFVFLPTLVFLLGCIKNESKKSSITEGKSTEDKSLYFSTDAVKVVSTTVNAVKDSISAVNSAKSVRPTEDKMVTSRMVTGRVITSRAPRIKQLPRAPRIKQLDSEKDYCSVSFQDCATFGIAGECSLDILQTDQSIYFYLYSSNIQEGYSYVCTNIQMSLICEDIHEYYDYVTQNCVPESYGKSSDSFQCSYYYDLEETFSYSYQDSSGNYHYIFISPRIIGISSCEANGICTYTWYSCPENVLSKDLCDRDINYLKGLTENCKISSIGEGSGECSVYDWDYDGQHEEVYFWYGKKSFSFWINDFEGKGKYLMYSECEEKNCTQYMSSYKIGEGNCSFEISCDSFTKSVTDEVDILKKNCAMNGIGSYSHDDSGEYKSCMQVDLTGDGEPDKAIDDWQGENGVSFIAQKNGEAEKIECQGDSCTHYYAKNCVIQDNSCEIPKDCQWKKGGEDWGEKGCFDIDMNGDNKHERILYISDSGKQETLIASEETFVYISCPHSGDQGEYPASGDKGEYKAESGSSEYCVVKVGKCKLKECPSGKEALTHDFVNGWISECSLSDYTYGKCNSIDDCEHMIYGYFGSQEGDDDSCSIVLNSKTGEFIKIRKVEGGYEYTKGTTEGFFSALCPLDSKVDFKNCSISGCEADKSADFITKLSGFVENATKQVFTLRLSDSKRGISGEVTVEYYSDSGTMIATGRIESPGGTIDMEAYLNEDGSVTIKFSLTTPDGRVLKGKFSILADGSGEGEITDSDGNTYRVVLRRDGTYEICDSSGRCSS